MNDILLSKSNRRLLIKRKSDVIFVYIFTILLFIVSSFLDSSFLTVGNMTNMVATWLPLILAGFAQTFVIIMGGIDLNRWCGYIAIECNLRYDDGPIRLVCAGHYRDRRRCGGRFFEWINHHESWSAADHCNAGRLDDCIGLCFIGFK